MADVYEVRRSRYVRRRQMTSLRGCALGCRFGSWCLVRPSKRVTVKLVATRGSPSSLATRTLSHLAYAPPCAESRQTGERWIRGRSSMSRHATVRPGSPSGWQRRTRRVSWSALRRGRPIASARPTSLSCSATCGSTFHPAERRRRSANTAISAHAWHAEKVTDLRARHCDYFIVAPSTCNTSGLCSDVEFLDSVSFRALSETSASGRPCRRRDILVVTS